LSLIEYFEKCKQLLKHQNYLLFGYLYFNVIHSFNVTENWTSVAAYDTHFLAQVFNIRSSI
jgi:hypothetical protein